MQTAADYLHAQVFGSHRHEGPNACPKCGRPFNCSEPFDCQGTEICLDCLLAKEEAEMIEAGYVLVEGEWEKVA